MGWIQTGVESGKSSFEETFVQSKIIKKKFAITKRGKTNTVWTDNEATFYTQILCSEDDKD